MQTTLQKGDHCTESMSEETYNKVCQAFINAGAGHGESFDYKEFKYRRNVGWSGIGDATYHASLTETQFDGRNLTADQIINATNAGGVQPQTKREGGRLENLNGIKEGSVLSFVGVSDGVVAGFMGPVTTLEKTENVVSCRLHVKHNDGHESYHEFRHDGRSKHDAEMDIVSVSSPEPTDREKFIESGVFALGYNCESLCKLYDAGFRAPGEDAQC